MSLMYYIIPSGETSSYESNMINSLGSPDINIRMSLDNTSGLMMFKPPYVPNAYSGNGYTLDEIKIIMNTEEWSSGSTEPFLRIYEYKALPNEELLDFDFTLLGLHKFSRFNKGRKYLTEYYDEAEENIVVCKRFEDINISGTTKLDYVNVTIEWMNNDDTVGLEKEFSVTFSEVEKGDYLRKRRQRAIDYIVYFAQGTPLEPYMDILFAHYKDEMEAFVSTGSSAFEDALNNESDPTILAILNTPANPENGDTVKEGILRNI